MATVTIGAPINAGSNAGAEITGLSNLSYPLTLTQDIAVYYSGSSGYNLVYDGTNIKIRYDGTNYITFTLVNNIWTATDAIYNSENIINYLTFSNSSNPSSITISNFQNPGNNNDADVAGLSGFTYPLTLTQGVALVYPTDSRYELLYNGILLVNREAGGTTYTTFTLSGSTWTATSDKYNRPDILNQLSFTNVTAPAPTTICFFGDAPVLTAAGYKRIDSLRPGQKVITPEGKQATIMLVKVHQCEAGPGTNPYVIPAGMYGATQRLLISPRHKVMTPSGMVEAQHLGLEREIRKGRLTYYNLELKNEECMVVAGVHVESLAAVRRITVTKEQFKAIILKKYGATLSAEVIERLNATCRFVSPTHVEIPVFKQRKN